MLAATPYRPFAMILFLRYLGNRILLVLSRRGPGLHTKRSAGYSLLRRPRKYKTKCVLTCTDTCQFYVKRIACNRI